MELKRYFVFKFLSNRLKDALIIGIIISLILFAFLGENIVIQYYFGFIIGFFNFMLLTVGMDLILILKPKFVRLIHFIFFAFRYLAITIVIVLFILHKDANAFVVVGGLLTMNFSIFVVEMKKHLLSRKEG